MHPEKSSLSIRLTEPVVPLRHTPEHASRHREGEVLPPGIVRGLLTLELAKPTRISSIELELQARASTSYPQGAGPSRVDVTEQYKVHSASSVVFKAGPVPQVRQRDTSARPRVQFLDNHIGSDGPHGTRLNALGGGHRRAPSDTRSASLDPLLSARARQPLSSDDWEIDESRITRQGGTSIDPAPPYPSPDGQQSFLGPDAYPSVAGRSQSVASSSRITESQNSPFPFRRNLTSDVPYGSPSSSVHSIRDLPLSRTSSIEELPEDDSESFDSASRPEYYGLSRIATGSSGRSSEWGHRGRSHSRFSFGKVVHIFDSAKDRVRSRSPRARSRARSGEQEERGRSLVKAKGKAHVSVDGVRHALPQIGVGEPSAADGANDQSGDGWVLFAEGTYTYPIFFTIPYNSPPTMKAHHGSLIWKVKAEVKRPGVFKSRMTAQKEVLVVSQPNDEDSDEIEGVDLERQWDSQLQYRVHIAGRGFPIGGKVPFQLTIMPLAKIKLHCVFIYLDERTEYYTRAETQARSDVIRRATLLVVRQSNSDERYSEPILPLNSDEPDAFRKSPLYRFLRPGEDEGEVASSLTGLGPWTIHHHLNIPDSCSVLHPSNRTKGSNVKVDHTLKIILRAEREETVTTGKKKLYDIVIHTPIQILSCRCTSEWTSLPRYDEVLGSEVAPLGDTPRSMCPCRTRHQAQPQSHAADTLAVSLGRVTSPPTSSSTSLPDSLARRTRLHERLMSGFVSERGEAPPSYEGYEAVFA